MHHSGAIFSANRVHRYELWRYARGPLLRTVAFIGLNPSTADEVKNDRTVGRCLTFAREWGFAHFYMLNIFAYRTPYPNQLRSAHDPVGEANDGHILQVCQKVDLVVAAWGVDGEYLNREEEVLGLLRFGEAEGIQLHHLGLTKGGHPRHPLYLPADTKPKIWNPVLRTR